MKIRIKSNTIRLRLAQDEVQKLSSGAEVMDRCKIADSEFVYGIIGKNINDIELSYESGQLMVAVSNAWVEGWYDDERVGFDFTTDYGTYVLIEKDFKCLIDREHEDESNLYHNPRSKD